MLGLQSFAIVDLITIHGNIISGISENTVKLLLCDLAELTNRIYCNSQHEALMNTVPSHDESY